MNFLCSELREMISQYSQEFSQIYAQKIPARCQNCHYDTVPEPFTWLSLSNLIKKGERIFFCEQHIDYNDRESIYFSLTNGIIWCRKCESRFSTRFEFNRTISTILDSQDNPGIRGLKNLGNTCYMNSVIQSLSNCSELKYFCQQNSFYSLNTQEDEKKIRLTQEFMRLIRNIWEKGSTISPSAFVDTLYNSTQLFLKKQQSDAHEFLMYLLNIINETVNVTGPRLIDEIFKGQIANKTTCSECKSELVNTEDFYDITLPVVDLESMMEEEINMQLIIKKFKSLFSKNNKKVEIMECLKANFAEFVADDSDMPNWKYCNTCNQKAPFKKETLLKYGPKSLILVLKRYSKSSKSSIRVYFPLSIDLSQYLISKDQQLVYNLYGIVEHVGFLNIGHYKAYCRNHMDKKWYCFDDTNITEIPLKRILKIQGYIGFYELETK